eukprot:TRINITY_DN7972_c0_g1_i1.p1 TRINITY_DN7972_c0_g1~~TRINITY_DN7972_c0_g1_i1.p1  ORF type:complete len:582 (-),score=130.28 TRINITY_DN7972_c0_g1_i1:93-1838(-)
MAKSTRKTLAQVFEDSQRTLAAHKKCISTAVKIIKSDPSSLPTSLFPLIDRVLPILKREPCVERVIKFIAGLTAALCEEESTDTCWEQILKHLLARSNARDKAVRFRATQLITEILQVLPEEIDIQDNLWDELLEAMTLRTKDKVASTRVQAVGALVRLQDPSSAEDPVTKEYLRLISSDSAKEVRRAVIQYMAVSRVTLPHLLQRTRDTSDDVRRDAFEYMGHKVDIRSLSISQRVITIMNGLQDRSEVVRKAASSMICSSWLVKNKGGDVLAFLGALDVHVSEKAAELALKEIVSYGEGVNELPEIDIHNLTCEEAIYWRVLCEHWAATKRSDLVDIALPESTVFCQIVSKVHSTIEEGNLLDDSKEAFILHQLLRLAKFLDFGDEAGRRTLLSLVQHLVATTSSLSLIVPLMTVLRAVFMSSQAPTTFEVEYTRVVLEVMSEARDQLESFELDEMKQAINNREDRLTAIKDELANLEKIQGMLKRDRRKQNTAQIETTNEQIAALVEESNKLNQEADLHDSKEEQAWGRVLRITRCFLEHTNMSITDAGVAGLREHVMIPAIQHPRGSVMYIIIRSYI